MPNPARKTRADKGLPRSSTLSGLIVTFMAQPDEARRVLIEILKGVDQDIRDGNIIAKRRGPSDGEAQQEETVEDELPSAL